DTGMGLERLACVCQNVGSLFDVDTVRNITSRVSELTGSVYHANDKTDVSLRVITDHIRASVMMICDGILPSNEGRGYVLRRLLRRAARHGRLLGVKKPFLWDVVETVVRENETAYPDVREKQAYITKVIRTEEENFARTLDAGLKIYGELLAAHKERGETVFSGADAFRLYDTYGFPIDLTVEMAEEEGMTVDRAGFEEKMEVQRQTARKAREALGDLGWAGIEFGSDMPATEFDGYEHETVQGKVLAIVVEGELADEIVSGAEASVVLDRTALYAEMGGQVGDHGVIASASENGSASSAGGGESASSAEGGGPASLFRVTDVQKNKGGKFLHTGRLEKGTLKVGDLVTSSYNKERRDAVRRAHTATHLLDAALRKVLGDHVHQAGSLVEPDRLRFDFTHFEAETPEQLSQVSALVNGAILDGLSVVTEVLPIEEAKKKGAVAVFGEKYGETVRVVEMEDFSMEFCGGTHLDNTAKAGIFRIQSESSIASGVRRMEAVVGLKALELVRRQEETLFQAAALFKVSPAELCDRIEAQTRELKEARKSIEKFKSEASLG
ncbi:MAG: alanine--tRNA ligase, partial [Oscillibacter sp.]|nr:alanine--tRNA ligase [Oscillibacter sp.]